MDTMDLKHNRSVKLNDGNLMPVLGFGTFASDGVSGPLGNYSIRYQLSWKCVQKAEDKHLVNDSPELPFPCLQFTSVHA